MMTLLYVLVSTSLVLSSLGLSRGIGYTLIEFGVTGWRGWSILLICWIYELLKPQASKKTDDFALQGHTSIETTMRNLYGIIVPLTRRIRKERDERTLRILQQVLLMDDPFEKPLTLACKALGFDKMELINVADSENASFILQNVPTEWGNFSRIEVVVLFSLPIGWVVSGFLTVWTYLNGILKQNFLLLMLFFMLPVGIVLMFSPMLRQNPGKEYDLAKRHDERFKFTQSEYQRRRIFDMVVLLIATVGATFIGVLIVVLGNASLANLVIISLCVEYVLSIALVYFDSFMLDRSVSDEETIAHLHEIMLRKQPLNVENIELPDNL